MRKLEVQNISKSFDGKPVLQDISIELGRGELVCLLGASGGGKTTLFNVISGLLQPDQGSVLLDGNDITNQPGHISYMLQKDCLLSWRTVLENCLLGLEVSNKLTSENIDYVLALLKTYGLEDFKDKYPSSLSGGMRQRVMIAMALACRPKILIADEPTTALDVTIQAQILDLLRDLKDKIDGSIMLITHDLGVIAEMADYVVVMYAGKVIEKGTVLEINQA